MIKLKDKTATDIFFMGRAVKKAIHKGVVIFEEKENFSDDTARQLLGKDWRMPTRAECQELINNCDWTWTTIGGVNGYEVKSKTNRNSIFLGLFGRFDGSERRFINENGNYWANESIDTTNNARSIHINASNKVLTTYGRYLGHNIRPVSETKGIDLGLSVRWAECNIGATIPTDFGNYYQWADSEIKTSYTVINNVYYIDGAYRKYNSEDKLTTLELVNTDPIIQSVPLWHFIKKHYDESSKTLDTTDFDLEQEEIDAIIEKLWQVTETRTLKVSFATYKLISDEQRAVVESRGWSLVRQEVYQLLDANANGNTPKVGQSYVNANVEMSRDSLNQITLKGVATYYQVTMSPSYYTRTQGHKYLIGGFNNSIRGHYMNGKTYETFYKNTIYEALASGTTAYISVVIEQGVTYDDVIRPFVIDITATFANKGQDFIDSLDTADKVAQALGSDSYEAMPYFDFKPFDTAQASLANAVMALSFYDAEKEDVNDINDLNADEDEQLQ